MFPAIMTDDFLKELEDNTSPQGHHRRYGDVLIRCKKVSDNEVKAIKLISFNPSCAIAFGRFFCKLADKHAVTITGEAQPTLVGPSVTGDGTFFTGMNRERLLRFYAAFGFESQEIDGRHFIKRRPKNEVQSES